MPSFCFANFSYLLMKNFGRDERSIFMITTILLVTLVAMIAIIIICLGSTIMLVSKILMIGLAVLVLLKIAKKIFFPDGVKRKKKGDE